MTSRFKRRAVKALPSFLFFGFITYLIVSADTDQKNGLMRLADSIAYGDKLGHFLVYGTMALLLNRAMGYKRITIFSDSFSVGSLIVLAFAVLEEFSQLAFASRTFDLGDILFDVMGIAILASKSTKVVIESLYMKFSK